MVIGEKHVANNAPTSNKRFKVSAQVLKLLIKQLQDEWEAMPNVGVGPLGLIRFQIIAKVYWNFNGDNLNDGKELITQQDMAGTQTFRNCGTARTFYMEEQRCYRMSRLGGNAGTKSLICK